MSNYDVVIVGAGICGAIVAKRLAQEGKSVLILEAGAGTGLEPEGYRSFVDNYHQATVKVPNSPYPFNPNAPQNNDAAIQRILQSPVIQPYLVQYGPLPFSSGYTRNTGGTTLHWLGTCLRMLPNDFRLRTLYGQGVDWPIDYWDLKPFYELAEREIGVAADVADQIYPGVDPSEYFGEDYEYSMHKVPQSYLDRYLTERIDGWGVDFGGEWIEPRVESTPQGRNSMPNRRYYRDPETGETSAYQPVGAVGDPDQGQRCEGNSSCVPICPVQAKYSAMKTVHSAQQHGAELITQAVASKIEIDPDTGRVAGIVYKQYQDPDVPSYSAKTAHGKVYVIAAHAIETAKLLLASDAANSSDQVGRNLMDHPCFVTWGLLPESIGSFRGPGSTSGIPSFRDGAFRSQHASFRVEIGNWGWSWPAGSPNSDVENAVHTDNLFGKDLRRYLAEVVPRQFRIAWEPEQTPEARNRVTIDRRGHFMDDLGNYRPLIHYDLSDYTKAGIAAARRVNTRLFEHLGVEDFTEYDDVSQPGYYRYRGEGYVFRGAGHVVGTHRMGFSRSDSVVDRDQRTWDHENLYLVGCGNMSTLGTANPTLTIAALSFRAAENILDDLKS